MAGLSLKHIYKVYAGRNTQKKGLIKTVKNLIKKSEQKLRVLKSVRVISLPSKILIWKSRMVNLSFS